ncbi:variable large family protein (plasmid) [Borrelia miyamotoi]|uniref:Variable large protein n=1 Tax=Borrelia miyamotoi TaxID=47466 RepID=A0AAQ3CNQ2_9SPIR|nr:variable large family protein [Borrelia miyamotoi]ATQ15520.2 variable large family protein [Borrelia miyamotoi]ATQ17918.2 variable large family protein [Borrelia miyamotoi]ATQ19145.2 variable large family protein [Borrelia miyamotoi]ATQ20421.2 variable large family protein [Borrelia miyamotoi]ATQ21617.2 variable large family protein [Borrelia miyamotoi]
MKRKTLSAIIMTLFLGLVSCNSSATVAEESPQSRFLKSVISLGNDFLNLFTSFGDMVGGVLGFNTNTKKSDVGSYFKKVHDTVEGIKTALEKIVSDMRSEGNPNAEATDTAVKKLVSETLSKIIEGAKTASEAIGDASDPIGNVAATNAAGAAGTGIDSLVKGIKGIVEVVLKEGNAEAGNDKKAEDGNTARTAAGGDGEAGKLFTAGAGAAGDANNSKKVAADAAKAVGAVTGADILKAMVKDNGDAAKLATSQNAGAAPKDATIAGGIALRVMSKDGKFAGPSAAADDAVTAVKGVAVSAVTKALDTLTIAIRNTIDLGLKEVKEAMKINVSDTPVTPDNITSEVKSK